MLIDYTKYFQIKTRVKDQKAFYCLTDDKPKELYQLVFDIHQMFDALPNDWIFKTIYEAFDELSRDLIGNISIEADIYLSDLKQWFLEPYAISMCDDYLMSIDHNPEAIIGIIIGGQWMMKDKIYHAVSDFLTENNS